MNTFLSDNDAALRSGGIAIASQAANAVLYATSATQLGRLAAGTSGYFLKTLGSGSAPVWADATTAPGGSDTYVQFNDGGSFGGDSGLVFNKTTNDLTISGDLIVSGAGPHAIGSAVVDYSRLTLAGSFTSGGASSRVTALRVTGAMVAATGDTTAAEGAYFDTSITTSASETISRCVQVAIGEPTITVGSGGTVTASASLYVSGAATEATSNYSAWIADGASRFDGDVGIRVNPSGGDLCIDATNSSTPTIRFENSEGTVDGSIDTWDSSSSIQIWMGANEYLNGGSPARFNTSYDTAAVELQPGLIALRTGSGATSTSRVSIDNDGDVVMGKTLTVNPAGTLVAADGVYLGRSTSNHLCTLESQRTDSNGATLNLRLDSSAPSDNDQPARLHAYGRDDGNTDRNVGRIDFQQEDVSEGSQDSSIKFSVQNNSSSGTNTIGYLSISGVWTDASDEHAKHYTGPITERRSKGTVLERIARLETGCYCSAHLPEGKTPSEYHSGPSAQQMWSEFGLGQDPETHDPGVAPKDLASVALAGLQELLQRVEALESE